MVFQYQYQYQYQLQRGLGLTTYDSFSQILHDTYSNPIIMSLVIAVGPLLFFFFRDRIRKTKAFLALHEVYMVSRRRKQLKRAREEFEETFLGRHKRDLSSVILVGATLVIGGLIFSQSLFFVAVTSNSMAPTFWSGDLVLIQSVSRDAAIGDIVVFQNPNVAYSDKVIHRLSSIDDNRIKTRGDNNNFPDDWILKKGDVIGRSVTFNGRPIVAKKVGRYFIKNFDITQEDQREFKLMRGLMRHVHTFGPVYLLVLALLILLIQLEQPKRGKVY